MKDSDWKILYELYKTPNLTRVANLLYMTQPSLTKRLQHMEEEFGVSIVNRLSRGLIFTAEGRYLGQQAEIYLKFLEETKRTVEQMRSCRDSVITIGSSYTFSKYSLSGLLMKYRDLHPDVDFNVVNEPSDTLFRYLLDGTVDVAFVRGDYEGPVKKVFVEKTPAYVLTREPAELADLPGMQRLAYRTNAKSRDLMDNWYREQFDMEPPANMVIGYVDVAWQMASEGVGYVCCFLPRDAAASVNLFRMPMLHKDGSPIFRNTWFTYLQGGHKSKALKEFILYIEQEMEKNGGKGGNGSAQKSKK